MPIFGPAVSYRQQWLILSAGVGISYPFHRFFSAGLSFQISPLILCIAQDQHFSRRLEFNDHTFGGIFLQPKGEFIFSPTAKLSFIFSINYRHISGSRGDVYTRDTGLHVDGSFSSSHNSAGAGFKALDTGLSVRLRF